MSQKNFAVPFFTFTFAETNQTSKYMRTSVLLKVNERSQDAKILVKYLMTLPYVELIESDGDGMPDEFSLPLFCPETIDDLKTHFAEIERNISDTAMLVDNEDVINCSKNILQRHENQVV